MIQKHIFLLIILFNLLIYIFSFINNQAITLIGIHKQMFIMDKNYQNHLLLVIIKL